MNDNLKQKVTSYRVRNFDNEYYVVESYTMQLEDELSFYLKRNINYYIRYNSDLRRKRRFQKYIQDKCKTNKYNYKSTDDIEEFNAFLAIHYFSKNALVDRLTLLNELASQYIEEYNSSINNETINNNEVQLSDAKSYLSNEIDYIKCINVGQANFSIGYDKDKSPCSVFDIGIRISRSAGKNINYAVRKLKDIDEKGIVVISHYDADHINGYRYMSSSAANRIWILPSRRLSPTPTERNFLKFVNLSRCIFLKDIEYKKTPFNPHKHILKIRNLYIYQGNAKKIDSCQSTNENARCLICLIKKEKSILLPADSLYEEFPTKFNVDYIVIPHHCCYYNKPIINVNILQLKELIVSAGPNERYNHPDMSHLRFYHLYCKSKNVIYLMNNDNFYFCKKNKISNHRLIVTDPLYEIIL